MDWLSPRKRLEKMPDRLPELRPMPSNRWMPL